MSTDLGAVQSQLRTLQDTYTAKQDAWIKEKLDMQVCHIILYTICFYNMCFDLH